ncbi:MAG: AAA family ATPase [Candidatus Latescibacterota bacterium]|nr:MAG: AAA family ATPase [Candidatus Latescibacterota bacterium]
MTVSLVDAASSVREALKSATRNLVERESLAELIVLAAVACEHMLVIGAPGTAKSAVVGRVARALGGTYFEYLLGRFTEPSEIFGPVDLKKLREGRVETETTGMLPEADVAFLDEVFLGSTAILNTLLGILNERAFRRGHTRIECPLRVCVGASNDLPEDESLTAFADRFLVHVFLDPVPDNMLESLLEGGWEVDRSRIQALSSLETLDVLTRAAAEARLDAVRTSLAHSIRLLRHAGVHLSDRRLVKSQRLIAAAAALDGREQPSDGDLWPLLYVIPTRESQTLAKDVLHEVLSRSTSATLTAAAEEASLSVAARAQRLVERMEGVVQAPPEEPGLREEWHLRFEAWLREVDAGFAEDQLPDALRSLRDQIVNIVRSTQ